MLKMTNDISYHTAVLAPPSWTNEQRGDFLEKLASKLLARQRFNVTQRVRFTGMEIDVLADHKDTHQRAFVECKFQRDPISANTVDLLLGKAFRKQVDIAYLFTSSPLGKEAKGAIDEMLRNPPDAPPRFAYVGPTDIAEMLIDLYDAGIPCAVFDAHGQVGSATIVITPQISPFWVLEEHFQGVPRRAIILPTSKPDGDFNLAAATAILSENGLWEGLEVVLHQEGSGPVKAAAIEAQDDEIITQVISADSLTDYRPCHPENFIGRQSLQKQVWDLLDSIRLNRSNTRILALSGPSGFGKSSIVLKLADRFRNQKWRNKITLFPVDCRSARGPLFVAKAFRTAIQSAIDTGFVSLDGEHISIESTESLLNGKSVQRVLEQLRSHKRVMVIFFDQFEELLTNDQLFPVFEAFKRLAFDVQGAQENLVLGFSWRTGITLGDGNPAYHIWHGLSDLRLNLTVDRFSSKESSQIVTQFQNEIGQKLLPPLRRRLLEQAQGVPWLLKKLCIHVYREVRKGTQQQDLLERRLNIRLLFDEDLHLITEERELQCLKHIATNSPIEFVDLLDKFDEDLVNHLYSLRLISRAGQRFTVYWDVFREYLVDGAVPPIPWTYVPVSSPGTALVALDYLQEKGNVDLLDLASKLGYAEGTTQNIICDLQNLLLAGRTPQGQYEPQRTLKRDSTAIAKFLRDQFVDHIVIQNVYAQIQPGQSLDRTHFQNIVADAYSIANPRTDTTKSYSERLVRWFRFSGLLELRDDALIRPNALGVDFAKIKTRRKDLRLSTGGWRFLGSASPERVLTLAVSLAKGRTYTRNQIQMARNRNSADDLVNLSLAHWNDDTIESSWILSNTGGKRQNVSQILAKQAEASDFIRLSRNIRQVNPFLSNEAFGHKLSLELGKSWTLSSCTRYGAAAKRWMRFLLSSHVGRLFDVDWDS